jgi:O-antigen/teichoic acid export membrane protein
MLDEKKARNIRPPIRSALPAVKVAALRLATVLLSVLFSIAAARLLGVDDFGRYSMVMAIVGLGSVLLGLGIPNLAEREIALARGSGRIDQLVEILKLATLVALFLSVGLLILALAGFNDLFPLAAFCALSVCLALLAATMRGLEHVELSAVVDGLVRPALAFAALLSLGACGLTSWKAAITAQLIAAMAALIISGLVVRSLDLSIISNAWLRAKSSGILAHPEKATLIAGANFALMQFMGNLMHQAEILWLSALATPEDVAHFFAASRAASAVAILHGAVLAIAIPKITRLHAATDIPNRNRLISATTRQSFLLVLIGCAIAVLFSRPYLLLFGPSYLEAQAPLVVMLLGWLLVAALGPVSQVLVAFGQENWVWISMVGGAAAGGIAAAVLIPSLGLLGAALSFIVSIIVSQAVLLPRVSKMIGTSLLGWA